MGNGEWGEEEAIAIDPHSVQHFLAPKYEEGRSVKISVSPCVALPRSSNSNGPASSPLRLPSFVHANVRVRCGEEREDVYAALGKLIICICSILRGTNSYCESPFPQLLLSPFPTFSHSPLLTRTPGADTPPTTDAQDLRYAARPIRLALPVRVHARGDI